ncbi:hypothetical protein EYC84_006430 [Monilinia fructicola]|uniref:Uncharacterized protein n=1 Tax=Monilinia fructicola TaxID=38448 RepID=A0A5M9K748_MONFR|nr:hypothetical protein EYC84_006430 [Monilinia fructicola]
MGGKPRNFGMKEHRPSPLKQEVSQRPISMQSPSMGLVRDPMFWKRFSTAVHMSEVDLKEIESGFASERLEKRKDSYGEGEDWLDQQYKERRRCRLICMWSCILQEGSIFRTERRVWKDGWTSRGRKVKPLRNNFLRYFTKFYDNDNGLELYMGWFEIRFDRFDYSDNELHGADVYHELR